MSFAARAIKTCSVESGTRDDATTLTASPAIPQDTLMELCKQRYLKHMSKLSSANRKIKDQLVQLEEELESTKRLLAKQTKRAEDAEASREVSCFRYKSDLTWDHYQYDSNLFKD
jgi:hypothetical protein